MMSETKVCKVCVVEKPLNEFPSFIRKPRNPNSTKNVQNKIPPEGRLYYGGTCKKCKNKNRNNQMRQKGIENPEWRTKRIDHGKWYKLESKFGLTKEDYHNLLEEQNNCCAICGAINNGKYGYFSVDHCHQTNMVRGLLCSECNLGLGKFKDNPTFFYRAASYLNKTKPDIMNADILNIQFHDGQIYSIEKEE